MSPLPWHEVELAIQHEEHWLSEVLDFGFYGSKDSTPIPLGLSDDKMLRQIAIAIVTGTIQAREIQSASELGLWSNTNICIDQVDESDERHGGHWHQSMMGLVKQYFTDEGFEVLNEPFLNLGRADLGVYKPDYLDLFVEIGTTSLFKTWFNLKTMQNAIFLYIPTTSYTVEFVVNDITSPHNIKIS